MIKLKQYQKEVLNDLREYFALSRDPALGVDRALHRINTGDRYRDRPHKVPNDKEYIRLDYDEDAPFICIQIPTGGGKTLIAAHTIPIAHEHFMLNESYRKLYPGQQYPFVIWLTPSEAIAEQTKETLSNPNHPNHQALSKKFEKNLYVRGTKYDDFRNIAPEDIASNACVMITTIQSLRISNKDGRRSYDDDENLERHFSALSALKKERLEKYEDNSDRVRLSFVNLLRLHRPILIIDEAHNAKTKLSKELLKDINAKCIVEFTATPEKKASNVLSRVSVTCLKSEGMIKLPIHLDKCSTWMEAVLKSKEKQEHLEKLVQEDSNLEYIRPIVLLQAQTKGSDATVNALKECLVTQLKIPENHVAVHTGEQKDLTGVDLSDEECEVRYIVTQKALVEGWDCPFAYILFSAVHAKSKTSVEQLLGRVMRMPYVKRSENHHELNEAYLFISSDRFEKVCGALEKDLITKMGFTSQEAKHYLDKVGKSVSKLDRSLYDPPPIPRLCLKHGGHVIPITKDMLLSIGEWTLSAEESKVSFDDVFDKAEQRSFDVVNGKISQSSGNGASGEQIKVELPKTSEQELYKFLDRQLRRSEITQDSLLKYISSATNKLRKEVQQQYKIYKDEAIALLSHLQYRIKVSLEKDIKRIIQEKYIALYEHYVSGKECTAVTRNELQKCRFDIPEDYPVATLYGDEDNKTYSFKKHCYDIIGSMNWKEEQCAIAIDNNSSTLCWIRNLSWGSSAFWLPVPLEEQSRFYPDFLVCLKNKKWLIVEYKGKSFLDTDETKAKEAVGELWAEKSGHGFIIVSENDAEGIEERIESKIAELMGKW